MNQFNEEIDSVIRLRRFRYKTLIIALFDLFIYPFVIRFTLAAIDDNPQHFQNRLNDMFFYSFFNLGPYNRAMSVVISVSALHTIYNMHQIVYKSDIRVWNPLLRTLTIENWNQFVEDNLNFKPTSSVTSWLRNPMQTLAEWRIVLHKLQNYRQVKFVHPIQLFPYMNRKIRAQILYSLLIYGNVYNTMLNLSSKCGSYHELY